jgi:putative SOS response-associated peptidase YedK
MFRDAFRRSRCIIPASGYYEWQTTSEGKQPYFISPRHGSILSFAGLWDEWRDRANNETIASCTIIVTNANTFTRAIHDRMPAILEREKVGAWLSGEAGSELLKPAPDDALRMWPVSKRVSKPGNTDDASLIEPISLHSPAPDQGSLLLH